MNKILIAVHGVYNNHDIISVERVAGDFEDICKKYRNMYKNQIGWTVSSRSIVGEECQGYITIFHDGVKEEIVSVYEVKI